MGRQFEIRIVGIDEHRCDKVAVAGERLFHRCRQLDCVDCLAQDFVQLLRQKGFLLGEAKMTNSFGTEREVVDDMIKNVRTSGAF